MSPGLARKRASKARERAAPADLPIDIVVESPLWKAQRGAKTVLRRAVAAAAAAVPERTGELAVVLTDDTAIRTLNRTWRGKDEPTNVLSFPAQSPPGAPRLLGDIVIAYETTAREALGEGKPFRHHLAHLAVHGYLHLAGYDHEADAEAEAMERLEIAVLARLKVPNPYIARDAKG
jgi:probable rRNA maturation factor